MAELKDANRTGRWMINSGHSLPTCSKPASNNLGWDWRDVARPGYVMRLDEQETRKMSAESSVG